MNASSPSIFGALKSLILYSGVFYGGLWLAKAHDPVGRWMGIIFSTLAALSGIIALIRLTEASLRQSRQYRYSAHAHKSSGNLGDAKLVDEHSRVIKTLSGQRNGIFLGAYLNLLLFFDPFARGNAHWIIYAPSRSGKTACVITPTALHWFGGSLVLPSIKGDTVAIAKAVREQNGHRILIWNPFDVLGIKGLSFNPLKILIDDVQDNEGKNLQGYALLIAKTMIPKPKDEKEPFFRKGAVRYLAGSLIFLAVIRPWKCHLPGLNDLVWASEEERLEVALIMKASTRIGGLVSKYGHHLEDLFRPEYIKTFGPMRDYAMEATMLFDANTDFGKSLMGDDFNLKSILDEKTTFFPIIPEEKLIPYGTVIGLIMALLFEEIAALEHPSRILVLLDEAGNFGRIPNMGKAMTLLPELGLRIVQAFQSRNQHIDLYGPNEATNNEKQCTGIQSWAFNDGEEAKRWALRGGFKTIKSHNLQYNASNPHEPWRPSVSESKKEVISAYDILTLPREKQLIAINGEPLIKSDLAFYFEIGQWRHIAALNPYHPSGYPKDKPTKYSLCAR